MGKKDDKEKKRRPYRDIDDFISRIFEDFFERPFPDIFEEFNRMLREFFRDFSEMQKEYFETPEGAPRIRRYTWGFSIVIPPTGPPRIYRFGNIRPSEKERGRIERTEEFEPLASVYEEDGRVKVVVDLPGVDEESIKVDAAEDKVVIRAEGADRKYYKEIELPSRVDPKSVEASYRNGILELSFKKK